MPTLKRRFLFSRFISLRRTGRGLSVFEMLPGISIFLSLFLCANSYKAHAQVIDAFAGTHGFAGYAGDGGPAVAAKLSYPLSITSDRSGNVYIADFNNDVIRKVNAAGIISTYAGNNTGGYSGDGGLATAAQLNRPTGIFCDSHDNLFIIDSYNSVIRKVEPSGVITTIAGNGTKGYTGDGGPAIAAQLDLIFSLGITVDAAENIYLIQRDQHVVRKINNLGIITTIAGTGTAGDTGDGGPATIASLNKPEAVLVDNAGNVYISNGGAPVIRKINPLGIISTFAGTGTWGFSGDGGSASDAQFSINAPMGLAKDLCENIYTADYQNSRIRKINTAGIIQTVVGNGTNGIEGNGGHPLAAELWFPTGMTVDPQGNMYILDVQNNTVRKVSYPGSSITLHPLDVSLCSTENTKFSITADNVIDYAWQVNTGSGWTTLMDDMTFSGTTTNELSISGANPSMNNHQFRCGVTTPACNKLFSDAASLVVGTVTPSLNITTLATTVCQGAPTTFTATPQHEGSAPHFQWIKNSIPVGTNSTTFTDISVATGDVIECILTSNHSCATINTASSNKITMQVIAPVIPSLSIVASDNNVCPGTVIIFTSTSQHAGVNPVYTWFKNGVDLLRDSAAYIDTSLSDMDQIICVMKSDAACASPATATSNSILIQVRSPLTPAITISTANTSVCPGSPVTFSATITNGGASPAYHWEKNGLPVGSNAVSYTDYTMLQGDVISCILSYTDNCYAISSVISNYLPITVLPKPVVSLDKTSVICHGDILQLDAGNFASYLWNDGTINRFLSADKTGTYSVAVRDYNGCKGSDTTTITRLAPKPAGFLSNDTSFCFPGQINAQPGYHRYEWNTGATSPSVTVTRPGTFWVAVTDFQGCKGKDSITVSDMNCSNKFYMPGGFTPNMDGKNDFFKPIISGHIKNYQLSIFNRWGQTVFQSSDPYKGWSGDHLGTKQGNSVFVWACAYQFEGEAMQHKKGTVVLIR